MGRQPRAIARERSIRGRTLPRPPRCARLAGKSHASVQRNQLRTPVRSADPLRTADAPAYVDNPWRHGPHREGPWVVTVAVRRSCQGLQDVPAAEHRPGLDLSGKLLLAKDVQEVVRIQSEFFQGQLNALNEQVRAVGESAAKAASGTFKPPKED
ncbi:phasin family protein [Bradyrhizobium sp. WD16]|uniref:phasin family protein n=1 Tax=Bradyrhizobium sp. WD16 TaxID=1521768 RepID=UPI002111160C|nr:phasin family protein [Bradyrhizobium sp. WD16]UTD29666.1 hypothetical protein DB459_24930 [Bradyrhizobium sp. WD16]